MLPRAERLLRRPLDGTPRPDDPGRGHPDGDAGRGDRGARARGGRGFKVVMLPSYVKRPLRIGCVAGRHVRHRQRARLRPGVGEVPRARVVPAFHGPGEGSTFHDSISNPVFNHVGHFASAGDRGLQVVVPRRGEPSLPRAALPLPRGRRRLGRGRCSPTSPGTGRSAASPGWRATATPVSPTSISSSRCTATTAARSARDDARQPDAALGRHPEDPSDSFARLPVADEGRAAAVVRRSVLLRVRR